MLEEQLGKIIGRVNTKKLRDLYEASRERFKRIDERYAPGHTEAMVELVRGRPATSEEKLSPLPNGADDWQFWDWILDPDNKQNFIDNTQYDLIKKLNLPTP